VLICHEDHPLAKRRRVAWKQLLPYPLIFAGQVSGNRALLDTALGANRLGLQSFYEVQRSSTAVGRVAERIAAAVVPRLAKSARLSPTAQALYDMIKPLPVASRKKRTTIPE
jgi:DNA-binding transcriptional LysR family regulator